MGFLIWFLVLLTLPIMIFVLPFVYCYVLDRAVAQIAPDLRSLPRYGVWLLLVPGVGWLCLAWAAPVLIRSLRNEWLARALWHGDSPLVDELPRRMAISYVLALGVAVALLMAGVVVACAWHQHESLVIQITLALLVAQGFDVWQHGQDLQLAEAECGKQAKEVTLKSHETKQTTSVGFLSLSIPIPTGTTASLTKERGETVVDPAFYERMFASIAKEVPLVQKQLDSQKQEDDTRLRAEIEQKLRIEMEIKARLEAEQAAKLKQAAEQAATPPAAVTPTAAPPVPPAAVVATPGG